MLLLILLRDCRTNKVSAGMTSNDFLQRWARGERFHVQHGQCQAALPKVLREQDQGVIICGERACEFRLLPLKAHGHDG
jgi:hypothetical protein